MITGIMIKLLCVPNCANSKTSPSLSEEEVFSFGVSFCQISLLSLYTR